MTQTEQDMRHMDEALMLAECGRGKTSPNPMVGAIVVSERGEVVGTGFHEQAGGPHAEIRALDAASGRTLRATLYCTLEPCSHIGRTGPCAQRIVETGVSRVVVGAIDPNPHVSGHGVAYLRERGLDVDVGVCRRRAVRLNEVFFTWVTTGRPFVTVKIATSRDGKIAARMGGRTKLTSDAADRVVHRERAETDAIGVGSNTVLVDDPELTVRGVDRSRPLIRVVFDRRLRMPVGARLLQTLDQGPVVVMTSDAAVAAQPGLADRLTTQGVQIEVVSDPSLTAALRRLADLEVTSLVLEGGAGIHRAAWQERVIDRVQRFVAPVDLGAEGVTWIEDEMLVDQLLDREIRTLGPDVLTEGYVQRVD